ncbi:hypothetical protein V6N13_134309 [Hibiscus sabdariffa]
MLNKRSSLKSIGASVQGELKFNTDKANIDSHGESGIGGSLHDAGSKCLISFSKSVGITDCTSTEILAIIGTCSLFRKSTWAKDFRLVIETDHKFAADWLENPQQCPIIFKSLIEACLKECNDMEWRVSGVLRECNSLADSLAKKGIEQSHDMFSLLKF